METSYTWAPAGEGVTLMRLRNRGEPKRFGAITAPVLERAMRSAMTKDLRRLKDILERAAAQ
jgi:hypothetical protein